MAAGSFKCSRPVVGSFFAAPFWHGHLDHLHTLGRRCAFPARPWLAPKQAQQLEVSSDCHCTQRSILSPQARLHLTMYSPDRCELLCFAYQRMSPTLRSAAAAAATVASTYSHIKGCLKESICPVAYQGNVSNHVLLLSCCCGTAHRCISTQALASDTT